MTGILKRFLFAVDALVSILAVFGFLNGIDENSVFMGFLLGGMILGLYGVPRWIILGSFLPFSTKKNN